MTYSLRIVESLSEIGAEHWDGLLARQSRRTPFLSFAFLDALHESKSASIESGWQPIFLSLWSGNSLHAALPLYAKQHSYGEYVFDWAWADAYRRNGLSYYPKLLNAIPFTPVTGNRLLARDATARSALLDALSALQGSGQWSSAHVLFPPEDEALALQERGYLLRTNVQFHWHNEDYADFDQFLDSLDRRKRKNIRAERRKVADAGIQFRHVPGIESTARDWQFFYRCYARTYANHYSTPYLSEDFFQRIRATMPQHLLLVMAERDGRPVGASMLVHDDTTLYGRYWGAMEEISCLHFETAYYQPLEFCISHGLKNFEGGAQGEHKMARGFLPEKTWSAHWLAHPGFADAVERYLARENDGIDAYIDELNDHTPYRYS